MSSLTRLLHQVLPASLVSGFKYSHIAREQGAYRNALPGYAPYLGAHEPPDRTLTSRRARLVFDLVMAAKTTRVAEISALLHRMGLEPAATPEAWDKIGRWVRDTVEGSREPGSDRYGLNLPYYPGIPPRQIKGESTSVLRPLWQSVVLDLALLLGEHMIAWAQSARWSYDGEWHAGSCSGEPRVAIPGTEIPKGQLPSLHGPFDAVETVAWQGLHRRQQLADPPLMSLGEILQNAIEALPTPRDPRQEFIQSLEDHLNEHGDLPDNEDIVEWLIDSKLPEMPELPSRLASILDERDQRAGRTGTKDAWRLDSKR